MNSTLDADDAYACNLTEIKCDAPNAPKFGTVHLGTDTGLDSLVIFSCDEGYVLHGSKAARCTNDGKWNATVPACKGNSHNKFKNYFKTQKHDDDCNL